MIEISHVFGNDIAFTASGDIATASGTGAGEQRVLRRLLTSPGSYIEHVAYGAGLPAMVGTPADGPRIQGVIARQMTHEAVVAQVPAPVTTVNVQPDGTVTASIRYTDAQTAVPTQVGA